MLSDKARKANRKCVEDFLRKAEAQEFYGDLTLKWQGGRIYRRLWLKSERVDPEGEVEPDTSKTR